MHDTIKPKMIKSSKQKFSMFWLFLPNDWTDRVENFFMSSSVKLGCVFVFFKCRSYKICQHLENSYNRKLKVLDSVFSILPLLTYAHGIFQRKNRQPNWVVFTTEKFQLDKTKSRFLWRENLLVVFGSAASSSCTPAFLKLALPNLLI
jgi:hypothetical protein